MEIRINLRDDVLKRFGNQLGALGAGKARLVMSRALNHEGDKGRTKVKRVLVKQTAIKYGKVNEAVKTIRSTSATLTYTLDARGDETNISLFGAKTTRSPSIKGAKVGIGGKWDWKRGGGVSAAPWNQRRMFPHTFVVPAYGGRVMIRKGKGRFPLKGVYGPNIARELVKGETAAEFKRGSANIANRVAHEIAYAMGI